MRIIYVGSRTALPGIANKLRRPCGDLEVLLDCLNRAGLQATATPVLTLDDLLFQLQARNCQVVIAEFGFAAMPAPAVLAALQHHAPETPLILLSSRWHEEHAIECVKQGAADYVLTSNLDRLPLAVWKAWEESGRRKEQRERIERAHRESEVLFRLLFAKNPLPLFLYDLETLRFLEANEAAVARYGYSREEFLQMNLPGIRPVEEVPRLLEALRGVGLAAGPAGEWKHRLKNGLIIDVEVALHPLKIEGKAQVLAVVQDITARKREQEELMRARDAAEAVSRAKSEFLALVSDELRTPLAGIIGLTELMQLGEIGSEDLNSVKTLAEELLMMIDAILQFSSLEAHEITLDSRVFNLRDTLQACVTIMFSVAQCKGIALTLRVESDVPQEVRGDPARLRQIVLSLLSNAVKFTERGEVTVRVETGGTPLDHLALHFSVWDTGIGIPAAKQAMIFEAFAQAESSLSRRFRGTGLGLSISARLVELMGGRIWLESEEGRGTTVHFTVPFPSLRERPQDNLAVNS